MTIGNTFDPLRKTYQADLPSGFSIFTHPPEEMGLEEWEKASELFGVVAKAHPPRDDVSPENIPDNYFKNKDTFNILKWLGGAHHRVESWRNGHDVEGSSHDDEAKRSAAIDPLALRVLTWAHGLSSRPVPLEAGLDRYLRLNPEIRTHYTDHQVVLSQAFGALLALTPADLEDNQRRAQLADMTYLNRYMGLAYADLRELLMERGGLPTLAYNRISNHLYQEESPLHVYRITLNVTDTNKLDASEEAGTTYLEVAQEWLRNKFMQDEVTRNPEGTSFLIVSQRTPDKIALAFNAFERDIKNGMATTPGTPARVIRDFTPRAMVGMRTISRDRIYEYAIQRPEDLEDFRTVIEFNDAVSLSTLRARAIASLEIPQAAEHDDETERRIFDKQKEYLARETPDIDHIKHMAADKPEVVRKLDALLIRAGLEAHHTLAAELNWQEDHEKTAGQQKRSGQRIYVEQDLPNPGSETYAKLETMRHNHAGFVGPGAYDPRLDNPHLASFGGITRFFDMGPAEEPPIPDLLLQRLPPRVQAMLRAAPRTVGRTLGLLSHRRMQEDSTEHLGLLETFEQQTYALANAGETERATHLTALQQTVAKLRDTYRHILNLAVEHPGHRGILKPHRTWQINRSNTRETVEANFFVQRVAETGNTNIAAMEVDSWKAFMKSRFYGQDIEPDLFNTLFNRVARDSVLEAAQKLNIPHDKILIRAAKGDHLELSFPEKNADGADVNPEAFGKAIQDVVATNFPDRFHDEHKVEVLEYKLTGLEAAHVTKLRDAGFRNRLRESLGSHLQPHLTAVGDSTATLVVSHKNADGNEISWQKLASVLHGEGINASLTAKPDVRVGRFPIWVKGDQHLYGYEQPEGAEAFQNTVSLTVVFDTHRRVRTRRDVVSFEEKSVKLSHGIERAKKESLPHKGGLVDMRNTRSGDWRLIRHKGMERGARETRRTRGRVI